MSPRTFEQFTTLALTDCHCCTAHAWWYGLASPHQ